MLLIAEDGGQPWDHRVAMGQEVDLCSDTPTASEAPDDSREYSKGTTGTPVSNPTWTLLGSLPRETTMKGLGLLSFFSRQGFCVCVDY